MTQRQRTVTAAVVLVVAVAAIGVAASPSLRERFWAPTDSTIPNGPGPAPSTNESAGEPVPPAPGQEEAAITVVATGLDTPWEIAFLPDGDMVVTERAGTLRRIGKNPASLKVDGVVERGEGGLMGVALHPDFANNHYVYLAYTTSGPGNVLNRYVLDVEKWTLSDKVTIIGDIPAAQYHDGGRIAFGPDGMLYLTTGDANKPQDAQNKDSLAGKILRVNADGGVPGDNPFGNRTFSWGHRNPQGIAWDDQGRMWSTEHGPSGAETGWDEINHIVSSGNYGWPQRKGDEWELGIIRPKAHSGASETWAPAGIAFLDGKLYFAGLRGQALYQADPVDAGMKETMHALFREEYGRIRAVVAHGGYLYVSTSNRDGRGTPKDGDDKILRIAPSALRAAAE